MKHVIMYKINQIDLTQVTTRNNADVNLRCPTSEFSINKVTTFVLACEELTDGELGERIGGVGAIMGVNGAVDVSIDGAMWSRG